jgi:hypothetical protein
VTGSISDAGAAIAHLVDTAAQVRRWARDEPQVIEEALERAGEDVRKELGRLAVRVQTDPSVLREMAAEIRRRELELRR